MRLTAGVAILAASAAVTAACSHGSHSQAGSTLPDTTCSAPASAPRVDSHLNVIVPAAGRATLVSAVVDRLRLLGAKCPEARVVSPDISLPVQPDDGVLELRWLRGVGDDPTQAQAEAQAEYLLGDGHVSLHSQSANSLGQCTGTPVPARRPPPGDAAAGECIQVSNPLIDQIHPTKATVTPTADPLTWTLTLTLDQSTARRVASAPKPLFAWIGGVSRGQALLAGRVLTFTGHYDGGGTEARVDAINAQLPIPVVQQWAVEQ